MKTDLFQSDYTDEAWRKYSILENHGLRFDEQSNLVPAHNELLTKTLKGLDIISRPDSWLEQVGKELFSKPSRIYIDMDDTICDFETDFQKKRIPNKVEFPHSLYGFFRELTPIKGAVDTIQDWFNRPEHFDVWFLSRPSVMNPSCYSEKAEWIDRYFGQIGLERLVLATDKSLVKGDYLIDDEINCGQLEFEGKHMRFGENHEYKSWRQIKEYFG